MLLGKRNKTPRECKVTVDVDFHSSFRMFQEMEAGVEDSFLKMHG